MVYYNTNMMEKNVIQMYIINGVDIQNMMIHIKTNNTKELILENSQNLIIWLMYNKNHKVLVHVQQVTQIIINITLQILLQKDH